VTNPFENSRRAEIRIKGLPFVARASKLNIQLKADDRIRVKGMRFISKDFIREHDPRQPGDVIFRPAMTASAGTTHTGSTANTSTKPALSQLRVTNPVDLRLGGLALQGGERRLVELQFGLAESIKGPHTYTIDVENVIDGKVVGGVTNVVDIQEPEKQPPFNIWKLIAILIAICLIVLTTIIVRKK
jgi:hypothetical protein